MAPQAEDLLQRTMRMGGVVVVATNLEMRLMASGGPSLNSVPGSDLVWLGVVAVGGSVVVCPQQIDRL